MTPDPNAAPPSGRIITFYSYKGGTGRSMALANVAWLLASNGKRVLAIDWDLEAPGLHRYFRPFLSDGELSETPGLIDFFVDFVEASRIEARERGEGSSDGKWFKDRATLVRYSVPIDYQFGQGGILDLVGAGQQTPSYSARVNSYQWNDFYGKLGGGTFLEEVKKQLRELYDFILIDSRTGVSDTSGICTVQMPDDLVVCFTLNRQSMFGAAATALSADTQRQLPTGERVLRIWPVPTRVELNEKDRLEAARIVAKEQFASFLWHVPAARRLDYWGSIEILYYPYYAYEETLAPVADPPGQTSSLLGSMERLTARLTADQISTMPRLPPGEREALLARYKTSSSLRETPLRFFLSYASEDKAQNTIKEVADSLDRRFGSNSTFWSDRIPLGADWTGSLKSGLDNADVVIVIAGPNYRKSTGSKREVQVALTAGKSVVPLLINGATSTVLPSQLRGRKAATISEETFTQDVETFLNQLSESIPSLSRSENTINADDPHKGRFGGMNIRDGYQLGAQVVPGQLKGWFSVLLTVDSTNGLPLKGDVDFHLHPTFRPSVVSVRPRGRQASLQVPAWGAFTVGAVANKGQTRLELDLSQLSNVPQEFRER